MDIFRIGTTFRGADLFWRRECCFWRVHRRQRGHHDASSQLDRKGESIQEYVVTPKQLWLDGIANDNAHVRQSVAMPLGSGHSVEAQVTGQDLVEGLQFHVTPSTPPPTPPLSLAYALEKVPGLLLKAPNPLNLNDRPIFLKSFTGKTITFMALPSD